MWVTGRFDVLEKAPGLDLDFEVVVVRFDEDDLEPREIEIGLESEEDIEGGLAEGMVVIG